jgi:hypothetical protein
MNTSTTVVPKVADYGAQSKVEWTSPVLSAPADAGSAGAALSHRYSQTECDGGRGPGGPEWNRGEVDLTTTPRRRVLASLAQRSATALARSQAGQRPATRFVED